MAAQENHKPGRAGLLWGLLLMAGMVSACQEGLRPSAKAEGPPPLPPAAAEGVARLAPFGPSPEGVVVVVSPARQRLWLVVKGRLAGEWPVSTSRWGTGARAGSNRTPMGAHRVAARLGAGLPEGMLLRSRQPTGRMTPRLSGDQEYPEDAVTSRVLWLEGLEPGINQGRDAQGRLVDSRKRYIYIHGTPEEGWIGRPKSHGCVRMANAGVIALFEQVPLGAYVYILDEPPPITAPSVAP